MRTYFASSFEEAQRFLKHGYSIVAISCFTGSGAMYTMEKGSKWSRLIGSR